MREVVETSVYPVARERILPGDVVLLRSGWFHSPLSFATRLLLRTPYTHAAIAIWLEGGLWVSEMWADGNVLVPLSQYRGDDWDVYPCPAKDLAAVKTQVLEHMRDEIQYDFGDLVRIAAHKILGVHLPEADDGRMVCSSYVPHVLVESGWRPEVPLPSLMAPSDLPDYLGRPVVRYRGRT